MLPKGMWIVGAKMYAVCPDCEKIVCLNKAILGSMHICLTEEEKAWKRQAAQQGLSLQQSQANANFLADTIGGGEYRHR